MPSRRALLAGAVGVGAVGLGVGVGSRLRLGPIAIPDPGPATWPLARFDAGYTAANVAAAPPSNPSVRWRSRPVGSDGSPGLVVDRERVVVGRVGGTAALARDGGEREWDRDDGGPLALVGESLYVGPGEVGEETPRLLAVDLASGERRWSQTTRSEGSGLLATTDVVVVGGEGGLEAVDPDGGSRRWRDDAFGEAIFAVQEGRLYAAGRLGEGPVGRFRQRRVADVATGAAPDLAWRVSHAGAARALAATGDAVVGGFWTSPVESRGGGPGWLCLDPDGSGRWQAVEPEGGTAGVGPLAVAHGHSVAAVHRERASTGARVAMRDLPGGNLQWDMPVEGGVTDLAVAGETVLVGLETLTLVALAWDGTEQWRVDLPVTPARIAPVDGAVFVASPAGQVVALG